MDKQLQIFNYQEKNVRTVIKDGQPWFVAKDVCEVLEIERGTRSLERLDEDEVRKTSLIDSLGRTQESYIISESGLYSLVLSSNKPEAKQFKKWITKEVIPSIRKTGGYVGNDELFIDTYLPFADDTTKLLFKSTLQVVKSQNVIIQNQQKEISHKEEVIIGLVDNVGLADKRQVLSRVVRHNGANFQERWQELYRQFEMKYHISLNKRLATYNEDRKPKLKNKLDYIDKVMDKLPELYEIACKLYENDIKELTDEMYELNKRAV
jgi:prophage antirepressor-like protein